MEVKKIVEGMTAPQVAQVIDENFNALNNEKATVEAVADVQKNVNRSDDNTGVLSYPEYSSTEPVAVGDVRRYEGLLYRAKEAGAYDWDPEKWERVTLKQLEDEKLYELSSKVSKGISLLRREKREQKLDFYFKKGLTYCVKVEFDGIREYAQIGTLNPNDTSKYVDSSPIKYNIQSLELVFTASDDYNSFMVFGAPSTGLHTIEIILLDIVQKPTFNGLLNPETTTNGYVIQPIKSLFFFTEEQYLNADIQLGVMTYKDGKVQMHIGAIGGEVILIFEEESESRPTGMKHYKGQYGYNGKIAYIDMWFDWDLYIDEVWVSNYNVKIQPFPIGGSFYKTIFKDVVVTEDAYYQSLGTNVIINSYKGLSTRGAFETNIKKGKKYVAEVVFDGISTMFQMGSLLDTTTYIDATPVLSDIEKYTFEFEATQDAAMFIVYSGNDLNMNFELREKALFIPILESEIKDLKEKQKPSNTIEVASFDGRANEAMDLSGWYEAKGAGLNNRDFFSLQATETPFAAAAKINKYATAYNRKIVWDIDVQSNTKVCAFTQGTGLESLFAQGYCVVVDFSAKTFAIHKNYGSSGKGISETLPSVLKRTTFEAEIDQSSLFRIIMERVERTLKASLVYLKTNTILAELKTDYEREIEPSSGLGYDIPAITPLRGLMALYSAKLLIPNAKPCYLYIVGDSITEGVPCQQKDCWAYKVAEIVPNTIVSGRCGGNIDGVLRKIQDEASVLKPTYVMVTIGTNGGNTPEKLSQLVSAIKGIGATPIINTIYCSSTSIQASINADILALKEKCVRMDVATAINNNLSDGADASLFVSDGTHLNEQGNEKCYQQVLIDMPELYM